jgi:hypothetical protein
MIELAKAKEQTESERELLQFSIASAVVLSRLNFAENHVSSHEELSIRKP